MLKKSVLLFCIALFMLCSCGNDGGDVSQVSQTINSSTVYTTEDIESAMNVVKNYFKNTKGFQDCTLTNLYYDEAVSSAASAGWAEQYEAEEAIVLVSSFDVASSYEYGTLNADSTYQNFKWILVRSGHGKWTLETWGY